MSDTADEDLPLDFIRASGADGRVVPRRVLGGLLRRPLALGGLAALHARVRECGRALSEVAESWVLTSRRDASEWPVC